MKWIKVEDQLPEQFLRCLVTDGKSIEIMFYYGDYKGSHDWSSYTNNTLDVTHWMNLPSLPNEK